MSPPTAYSYLLEVRVGTITTGCAKLTYFIATGIKGISLFYRLQPISIPAGVGERGATTTLIWLRRADDPVETLMYGTQNGYVVLWKQSGYQSQVNFCLNASTYSDDS